MFKILEFFFYLLNSVIFSVVKIGLFRLFPKVSVSAAVIGILLDQITTIVGIKFLNCVETNAIPSLLINAGFHYWLMFDYAVSATILMVIIMLVKYLKSSTLYIAALPLIFLRFFSGIHNLTIIMRTCDTLI